MKKWKRTAVGQTETTGRAFAGIKRTFDKDFSKEPDQRVGIRNVSRSGWKLNYIALRIK